MKIHDENLSTTCLIIASGWKAQCRRQQKKKVS